MNALDELAVRAASDPYAFSTLYHRCYSRVYNYVRYRVDDEATAEELCGSIFERLLGALAGFRPERASFSTWLFAIARNTLNDHYRRQRLRRFAPLEALLHHADPQPTPEEQVLRDEQTSQLLEALGKLEAAERDLLALKFAAGLNNREIARLTGLSESNVGVRVYRAMQKLRSVCLDGASTGDIIDARVSWHE